MRVGRRELSERARKGESDAENEGKRSSGIEREKRRERENKEIVRARKKSSS